MWMPPIWRSDTLHLFFLFLPVGVLTAILYIVLARKAGALDPVPEEASRPPESIPARAKPAEPGEARRSPVYRIIGFLALGALVACVILPFKIYWSGMEGYAERLESFKDWLLLPTFVYFVTGTIWQLHRMKKRSSEV